MLSSKAPRTVTHRLLAIGAVLTLGTLSLTACGGSSPTTSSAGSSSAEKVGVSLIVKTTSNPFFVSMQDGAKKAAEAGGVDLKLAAGKADGDEETQIQAIENAISKGDKGILITPNGPSVVDALKKAKDAGLFVIALDTPPDPADAADITFATDNFAAGELIGKWTAAQLGGKKATIALLDLFDDKVVSVDYNRDQASLPASASTPRTSRRTVTRPRPANTPAARAATTKSWAARQARALKTAAGRRWRPSSPRTRTSMWSTPSTSQLRPAPSRR
jgi:fructose transport system substrate-binding protein